ncbi:AraC family transcriptional regulator N-terminal domain-containing protein [Corallincola platygyrae]|uniref:AraC family transcriptional regulator N-terminal domain-containing protein n=1 Tax=Corallincola platygyrae TaxID=1193278 RepID=A0ABW4XPX8_9GAMM
MNREEKLAEFSSLVRKLTPNLGITETVIPSLLLFRETQGHGREPAIYDAGIGICASGRKNLYLDNQCYEQSAGQFLAMFLPMAIECEVLEASEEEPLMGIGVFLDRHRLANLLLRMEQHRVPSDKPVSGKQTFNASGIISDAINDELLDTSIRIVKALQNPVEAALFGDQLIDELYFRILSYQSDGALNKLLQQQGQLQQISKAVEQVHRHLEKNFSVEELASIVNMSSSGFHKKFKEVMHLSPLQYAKQVKLGKAQNYLMEGDSVSEAGFKVGYNSPAQFSREYKRHFGEVPSAI